MLVAAIKPIDKELERGVVAIGQVEFLRGGFGEGALERGLEVVRAIVQQGLVDAEDPALGIDEDVDRVRSQQAKIIKHVRMCFWLILAQRGEENGGIEGGKEDAV